MYGAIIGDIAGSYYEVLEMNAKKSKMLRSYMEKIMILSKNTPLFHEKCSYTDDSVLTCAIADAIISNISYEDKIREYGLKEIDLGVDKYGRSRFGKYFTEWLKGDYQGDSYGNGCAMRIGPVGFLFDSLDDVKKESKKATKFSHNHEDSLKASEAISTSIFLLRNGYSKEDLKKYIEDNYYSMNYNMDNLINNYIFTSKASNSVPQAIYCFLISNNFEDAIRKSIAIGGDTDTIAAITGSLAEAFYGVPNYLIEEVQPYLNDYMKPVVDKFYKTLNKGKVLKLK